MKKPTVTETVFEKLFASPKANGPATWTQHVQRNLVPEVREEVQRYFGRIDCLEAQYPGLDYAFDPHRRRLASFAWHRRLFRAFDELRLTNEEILTLCNWEGTRAAKERFERESKTRIESTTLEGVETIRAGDGPRAVFHELHESSGSTPQPAHSSRWTDESHEEVSDDEDNDESVGVHLNETLIAAAAARERGEAAQFDAQWEQWMKDAIERNDLDSEAIRTALRRGLPFPLSLSDTSGSSVQESEQSLSNPVDEHTGTRSTSLVIPGPQFHRLRNVVEELGSTRAPDLISSSSSTPRPRTSSSTDHARLSTLVEELHTNNTRMEAENSALQNFLSRTRTETAR